MVCYLQAEGKEKQQQEWEFEEGGRRQEEAEGREEQTLQALVEGVQLQGEGLAIAKQVCQ